MRPSDAIVTDNHQVTIPGNKRNYMYPTILCNRITIHCTNKPEFNLHKKVYTCQVCFLRGYCKHLLTRTYFSIGSCILGYLLAIQTKQVLSNQVLNFYDGDNRLLTINPLNPEIKIEFSFVAPIHFLQTQWGEVDKISRKHDCMIMSIILMTTLFYKTLILQGEI